MRPPAQPPMDLRPRPGWPAARGRSVLARDTEPLMKSIQGTEQGSALSRDCQHSSSKFKSIVNGLACPAAGGDSESELAR